MAHRLITFSSGTLLKLLDVKLLCSYM